MVECTWLNSDGETERNPHRAARLNCLGSRRPLVRLPGLMGLSAARAHLRGNLYLPVIWKAPPNKALSYCGLRISLGADVVAQSPSVKQPRLATGCRHDALGRHRG